MLTFFHLGCPKHPNFRQRGLHRQGERLRPFENVLRQRQVQETVPALRPMEVDGHRVPQGRLLHHEVGRLELRRRLMGDLLSRPGALRRNVDRRGHHADQDRLQVEVPGGGCRRCLGQRRLQ